ncbi:MAG: cysteine hydrolase [Euryarchaeota archaeon]|nr:cysteine hydrolase [Euryarchaeota archaeon]
MTEIKNLALICIDLQREYFEDRRPLKVPNGPVVLKNVKRLINAARQRGLPVIHIRHISEDPFDTTFNAASPMVEFVEDVQPAEGELVITKTRPGAFYLTELDDILRQMGIDTVAICGLLSFMCCDTTAREAHARGYKVLFVKDATGAIDINNIPAETVHNVVCAVQAWMFSDVITTDDFIGGA